MRSDQSGNDLEGAKAGPAIDSLPCRTSPDRGNANPEPTRHITRAMMNTYKTILSTTSLRALQINVSDVLTEIEDLVHQHRHAKTDQAEQQDEDDDLAFAVHQQVLALRDVSLAVETVCGQTQGDDGPTLTDFEPTKVIEHVCVALSSRARSAGIEVHGSVASDMPTSVRGDEAAFRRAVYLLLYAVLRNAEAASLELSLTVERVEDEYRYINLMLHHPRMTCSADTLRAVVAATNNEHALEEGASTDSDGVIALFRVAQQVALREGSRLHMNAEPGGGLTIVLQFRWRATPSEGSERRINSRLRLEMVKCNYGTVIDLSRCGARIRSNQRLKGELELEIRDAVTTVQIPCRVCWVKQHGWRKYDIGLQFLDVTPDLTKRITEITMRNRWARAISAA